MKNNTPTHFTFEAPKPKIFQYNGKRIAIRLEPSFLRNLETISRKYGLKSNALIYLLKEKNKNKNFSSFLRSFIVSELETMLQDDLLNDQNKTGHSILETAPIPCIHLSENQTILYANDSFLKWADTDMSIIKEQQFNTFFFIQDNQSVRELLNRIKFGHQTTATLSVSYKKKKAQNLISLEAKAIFTPLTHTKSPHISFIVWLQTSPTQRPSRILKIKRQTN